MKKLISIPIIFLLVLSSLLINVNAALSSLGWDLDGTLTDSTITKGQNATFYYTGFTVNPPLTIKFDLLDSNNNIIKTYENRVLASQLNSFSNSYTVTSQDYNNLAGDYKIKAYTSDNINEYQIKYIYLNIQEIQDTISPTITVTHSPASPSTADQVIITATAADSSGISEINIYVDDLINPKKTCVLSPCSTTAQTYSSGVHNYYATAKDNANNIGRDPITGTKTFTVSSVVQQNQPPVLNLINDKIVSENNNLQFTITASDPENDPLTFSIINQPQGSSLIQTGNTAVFSWTPDFNTVQHPATQEQLSVTFKVQETVNPANSDAEIITITVLDVNRNPVITSTPVTSARVNTLYQYDTDAIDSDNDILTYSLTTAPAGMNINAITGLITWTPLLAGNYDVIIKILDTLTGIITQSFTINILSNIPPIANAGSDRTVSLNQVLTFDGSQSYDQDGSIVDYKWNFGDNTPTATGKIVQHSYSIKGTYTVTLTVTDNEGASASDTAIIIVNGAPTANINGPYSGFVNEPLTVDASQSTDNGIIVNYNFDFGDGTIINSSIPIVQHTYTNIGVYTIKLTVTDNDGLIGQVQTTAVITIKEVPPVPGKPRKVTIHKFAISNNVIVKETGNFLDFYFDLRNEGNRQEKIKLSASLDSQYNYIDVNLGRSENTWQIIRFNKPLIKGQYILTVKADNKFNDKDIIYKIINIK